MEETITFNMGTELPQDMIDDYGAKRYDICKEKCIKLLETEENNCFALLYLGLISKSEDNHEDAIYYFKKITTIEPRFPYTWDFLGDVYLKLEEYENAFDAFKEVAAMLQSKAEAWCKCALAAHKMGRNELAIGVIDIGLTKVNKEELSTMTFCKGLLEESEGNTNDAMISYIQSQTSATNDEDRNFPTKRIYKMLKSDE